MERGHWTLPVISFPFSYIIFLPLLHNPVLLFKRSRTLRTSGGATGSFMTSKKTLTQASLVAGSIKQGMFLIWKT